MLCSLLIYTFNRPEYLNRNLQYLKKINFYFNIYILDSSNDNNFEKNNANIKKLNLQIHHIKFNERISPSIKILTALERINTKYVLICPDDDFISLNGLKKCINFLENNLEYSVVHGNYYNYYPPGNNLTFLSKFSWKNRYDSSLIDDNSTYIRFKKYFDNYNTPLLYSLYRTPFLLKTFRKISKCITFQNGEWMQAMITVILTKIGYVNTFYLIKDKPLKKGYQYSKNTEGYNINSKNLQIDKKYIVNSIEKLLYKNKISESEKIVNLANIFYDNILKIYNKKKKEQEISYNFPKKILKIILPKEFIKFFRQNKLHINTSFKSFDQNERNELNIIKKLF